MKVKIGKDNMLFIKNEGIDTIPGTVSGAFSELLEVIVWNEICNDTSELTRGILYDYVSDEDVWNGIQDIVNNCVSEATCNLNPEDSNNPELYWKIIYSDWKQYEDVIKKRIERGDI